MANIVATNNENAAREAWQSFLRSHPRIDGFLNVAGSFCGYFLNGHAIVALVQWMVRVAGRVAESALLLATLYVTLNNVAHTLVTWILPANAIDFLNYLSLVAFSLLPELIVAAAIKVTVDHWSMFFRDRTWRNSAWIWATLYSLPTTTFVVMTIVTLSSFVQVVATSGDPLQATGTALTIRLFAGWGYAMIEILFATVGKKSYVASLDRLRAMISTQGEELSFIKKSEENLRANVQTLINEKATVDKTNQATITAMALEKEGLQSEIARLQEELKAVRLRARNREIARATPTAMTTTNNGHSPTNQSTKSNKDTGYMARDNGTTMAIANDQGDTIIATGSHRDRIKEAMLRAMQNEEDLSYGAIAQAANAGYSTVKKYAKELQEEIAREQTGEMAVVETGAIEG